MEAGITGGALPQVTFSSLLGPVKRSTESSREYRMINWVAELFEASGWRVEKHPRTQDPTVDPLLVDIDLLATRNGRNVLIDVSGTRDGAVFEDTQLPSAIIQAVWLLAEQRGFDHSNVAASLIIIDADVDNKVTDTSDRLGINLVLLDSAQHAKFLEIPESDRAGRARMAEELLQLRGL